jgi:ribosomal protein L34
LKALEGSKCLEILEIKIKILKDTRNILSKRTFQPSKEKEEINAVYGQNESADGKVLTRRRAKGRHKLVTHSLAEPGTQKIMIRF